ncbi:MAG TPA: MATE family efflux transporter [Polyangium sp.]|nr:MATE family efflux transporter [Polyangium sp.]
MATDSAAPSARQLLTLAWPIIVSRSAQTVISVSDAAMTAPLGQDALAATTTAALNVFGLMILPMGTVFIVSSFASQLFGRGDHGGARRYGFYGVIFCFLLEIVYLALLGLVPAAIGKLDYSPEVKELMIQYSEVRLIGGGAAIGLEALGNYYGGLGNTRLPMAMQIVCMVLNVALNWVLIYGHLGAPAMGVKGAALASTISTIIGFAILLGCFFRGFGENPLARTNLGKLRASEFVRMLRFGIPSGINWFVEFAAFAVFINVVLNDLGTTTLAAFMAAMQINQVSFMPAFGLTSAGAIIVGQLIGAKALDDVPKATRLTAVATCTWQGTVALIYILFSKWVMLPFAPPGSEQAAFLELGAHVLVLSATWQLTDALSMSFSEALRAAGDTTFTAWARGIVAWVIFVPGAYLSVRVYGGGIGWAVFWLSFYLGILAAILWWRFRSGIWRTLDMTGQEVPLEEAA